MVSGSDPLEPTAHWELGQAPALGIGDEWNASSIGSSVGSGDMSSELLRSRDICETVRAGDRVFLLLHHLPGAAGGSANMKGALTVVIHAIQVAVFFEETANVFWVLAG